jgi:hypothetical protein
MKRVVLALATLALPISASAQVAGGCLTPSEAEGLITYSLPSIIRSVSARCAATLPATAPLIQAGSVTAARYQIDADKAWPTARGAFDTLSGLKMASVIGDTATRKLLDTAIAGSLAAKLKPQDCGAIDQMIDLLQPLPAANMARLTIILMQIRGKDGKAKEVPFKLCPTEQMSATR